MWSFGIITDGIRNNQFHLPIIYSIMKQNIPNYEIIFITENRGYSVINEENDILKMLYIDTNKLSHITKKKNEFAKVAKYENLCILHDYVSLGDNWFQGMETLGYKWNVTSCRYVNLDSTRYIWDYPVMGHPTLGHCHSLSYDFPLCETHYIPGIAFCVKKPFFLKNPLDNNLIHFEGEDVKWSQSFSKLENYQFDKNNYFQFLKMR